MQLGDANNNADGARCSVALCSAQMIVVGELSPTTTTSSKLADIQGSFFRGTADRAAAPGLVRIERFMAWVRPAHAAEVAEDYPYTVSCPGTGTGPGSTTAGMLVT